MGNVRLSLILLCLAGSLGAQGTPELGLDVNAQSEASVAHGWPLLIRVVVISTDGQPLTIGLGTGAWTRALRLTVTGQNGTVQSWPVQLAAPAASTLSLSGFASAEADWLVAPTDTSAIADGLYNLSVTLDTTAGAATGSWSGSVQSSGATVQLQAEPGTLSSEDEASKYLAFAAYARLRSDTQGAKTALDTLMSHQPDILQAYTEKADLLAAGSDYAGALALSQQALDKFNARNPNPPEPATVLNLQVMDLADKLAAQQRLAKNGNTVASVLPGSTAAVITPDSIVSGYGAHLATATTQSSGTLTTSLGGTTVTIVDSAGKSTLAPLFYVSPGQVNYEVPPAVALGMATVNVKTGDGVVSTGAVNVVSIQPGLFTFNAAGLIAGSILRVVSGGKQVSEKLYAVDSSGAVSALPIDLSNGKVYLTFYGTGLRHAATGQVTVSIGGVNAQVLYAGAQGSFVGLDQVNVLVPPSLAGRGDVPLALTAAGKQSNTTRLTFK